jgi:hypothetical protein
VVAPSIAATGTFIGGTTASGTTMNFAKPTGVVTGSMLVALYTVEHDSSGTQLSAPTNWAAATGAPAFQAVSSGTALYVWWKYADATDAGGGVTQFAMPVQNGRWVRGCIMRLTDHATSSPWDAGNSAVSASSTNEPSTSVTTTGADRLCIWGASSYIESNWSTMPTSFTEISAYAHASIQTTTAAVRTVASATTVTTGTIATGAANGKAAWLGAVKPVGGATVTGVVAVSFGALGVTVAAFPTTPGTALVAFGALSVTTLGTRTTAGVVALDLGALVVTAAGAGATPPVTGTAVLDLGALAVTVLGTVIPEEVAGAAAVTPGGLVVTATGLRTTSGTALVALGALGVTAAGARTEFGAGILALGGAAVTTSGTVVPPPPGQIFDLSRFHLTLPTEDPGPDTDAAQIDQPALATYTDANFSTTTARRMRFVAPVNGATTSGASGATRSELRAHEADYDDEAFDPATTGRRQLTVTFRADPTSITGGSNPRQEGIVFQIHGAGDSPIPLILAAEWTSGGSPVTPRIRIFKNGPGLANPVTGIGTSTDITARCRVEDGVVRLWCIAGQVADLPSVDTTAPYEWPASDFTDDSGWFYKHGGYNKTQISSGSSGEFIVETSFIEILQPGDPEGPTVRTGTANATLGALGVAAVGQRITPGTASVALGDISVIAAGTVIAEVISGAANADLGGLAVSATGTRAVPGAASVALGGLAVSVTVSVTGSVRFDAPTDQVYINTTLPAPTAAGLTILGWWRVRVDTNDFATYYRTSGSGGSGTIHTVASFNTGLGVSLFTTDGEVAGVYANAVDEWVAIAVVDPGTATTAVYVRPAGGSTLTASGHTGTGTPGHLSIGGRGASDPNETLNGAAAHVRVFADALTQAEIEAEWASPTAVLTAWADWPLISADDLTDHSGNGRDLTPGTTPLTSETGPPLDYVLVPGSASIALGAPTLTAIGTRVVAGPAAVALGALSVTTVAERAVTGAASLSLGPMSVTAVGTVVAETVTGTALVAIAGPIVTGAGTRVVSGTAAVSLPELALAASGDGTSPAVGAALLELGAVTVTAVGVGSPPAVPGRALRAGVPVARHGLTTGAPVSSRPVARQPVQGSDRLTGVPMIDLGLRAGEPLRED